MSSQTTFFVPTRGSWSGGGKGVLNNYRHAASRHRQIRFDEGDVDIINRNFPNSGWRRAFVLAPQNAWPWAGPKLGAREKAKVAVLRVASEVAMRRAVGVIRVGHTIPARGHSHEDILPNPLDPDFDEQVVGIESTTRPGDTPYLLSLGSINSYRGIEQLLEGYRQYRDAGGQLPLRVVGGGQPHYLEHIRKHAANIPEVTINSKGVSRREALRLLHHADVAILPSHVEASPFSLLEALAVQKNVVASDIPGHRNIIPVDVPGPSWFSHSDLSTLGAALSAAEEEKRTGLPSTPLADPLWREELRVDWGDRLVAILQDLVAGGPRG